MKFEKITDLNRNCLSDESRLEGNADVIAFCESVEDIKKAVSIASEKGWGITVQGSRTGITGGAVPVGNCRDVEVSEGYSSPAGEAVINLSKMKQLYSIRHFRDGYRIKTGAGLTLSEIENILQGEVIDTEFLDEKSLESLSKIREGKYFFPPDPTEKSASIGGVAANCASGARSFHYGAARNFILSLDIILSDSSHLFLERGDLFSRVEGCSFSLASSENRKISGKIPDMEITCCKNAAGLYMEKNMDLIDLFIGSEGILGIIAAVEFAVIPEPPFINGILVFPPDMESCFSLAEVFRNSGSAKYNISEDGPPGSGKKGQVGDDFFSGEKITGNKLELPENCRIAAVEYFDRNSLLLVKRYMYEGLFRTLFPFSENSGGGLYIEIHSGDSAAEESFLERISGYLEQSGVAHSSVFISDGKEDLARMKDFRHSVPESVNITHISPR